MDGARFYQKRISPYASLEISEIKEEPPLGRSKTELGRRCLQETKRLLSSPSLPGAQKVLLAIKGPRFSTDQMATLIESAQSSGLIFYIGGAEGVSPELEKSFGQSISLSPLTFPHQMARIILLEQIYRCFKIINGEPYHK